MLLLGRILIMCLVCASIQAAPISVIFSGLGSGTYPNATPFSNVSIQMIVFADDTETADFGGRLFDRQIMSVVDGNEFLQAAMIGSIALQGPAGESELTSVGMGGREPRMEGDIDVDSWAFGSPGEFGPVTPTSDASQPGVVGVPDGNLTFTYLSFTQAQSVATAADFVSGENVKGSWFELGGISSGQGLLVDYFADIDSLFVAWFTFEASSTQKVGATDQRWLTTLMSFDGDTATGTLLSTSGGFFDTPRPDTQIDGDEVGTLTIQFIDCANAELHYELPAEGLSGDISIEKLEQFLFGDASCP